MAERQPALTTQSHRTHEEKLERLLDWLVRRGGCWNQAIYFRHDAHYGLAAFATADLPANSAIVSVPTLICITPDLARAQIARLLRTNGKEAANKDCRDVSSPYLTDKEFVVLYLVLHKLLPSARGSHHGADDQPDGGDGGGDDDDDGHDDHRISAFLAHADYVDCLPQAILTPLHFTCNELQLLRATPLHHHALLQRYETRISCRKAARWMLRKLESLQRVTWAKDLARRIRPPITRAGDEALCARREEEDWDVDDDDCMFLDVWRWAQTAYGSRAFPPRLLQITSTSAPVLIPCLDLFNHSREAEVTWSLELPRSGVSAQDKTRPSVCFTLHNKVGAGEQVMNSYGPRSNEEFLASYGFVDDRMLDDAVTLKLKSAQARVISTQAQPGRFADQYYWQRGKACPVDLLKTVETHLQRHHDEDGEGAGGDTTPHNRAEMQALMLKGESLELIEGMLQSKLDAFREVEKAIQPLLLFEAANSAATAPSLLLRPSVVQNVQVYRAGQALVIGEALKQAQSTQDDVAMLIDELAKADPSHVPTSPFM